MSSLQSLTSSSDASSGSSSSPYLSARYPLTQWFPNPLTPPHTKLDQYPEARFSTTSFFSQSHSRTILHSTSHPSSSFNLSVASPPRNRIRLPNYILRWDQARPLNGNIRTNYQSSTTATTRPKASATRITADHHRARPRTLRPRSKAKAWQMEKINHDLNRKIKRIIPCRALGRRHRILAMVCSRDPNMSPEGVDRKRRLLAMQDRTIDSRSQGEQCQVCCLVQCDCLRSSEIFSAVEERVRMRSREAFTNPPWLVAGSRWKGNVRIRPRAESGAGTAGPLREFDR